MQSKLKKYYEKAVNAYLVEFAKKYELDITDTYWIGEDAVGTGVLSWGDMYLNFGDIKQDIDKEYKCFIEWYWDTIEAQSKDANSFINLFSYNLGLRYEMPNDQKRLLNNGYKLIGKSVYSKVIDNDITTLNVWYCPDFRVYLSQKENKIYFNQIENIEQLFHFEKQLAII